MGCGDGVRLFREPRVMCCEAALNVSVQTLCSAHTLLHTERLWSVVAGNSSGKTPATDSTVLDP